VPAAHISFQAQDRSLIQPDQSFGGTVEIGYKRDYDRDRYWRKNQRQPEPPRQRQTTLKECDQGNQKDQEPN
jgi:hypothetical protein